MLNIKSHPLETQRIAKKTVLLAVLQANEMFGGQDLLNNRRLREFSVICSADSSSVLFMSKEQFTELFLSGLIFQNAYIIALCDEQDAKIQNQLKQQIKLVQQGKILIQKIKRKLSNDSPHKVKHLSPMHNNHPSNGDGAAGEPHPHHIHRHKAKMPSVNCPHAPHPEEDDRQKTIIQSIKDRCNPQFSYAYIDQNQGGCLQNRIGNSDRYASKH